MQDKVDCGMPLQGQEFWMMNENNINVKEASHKGPYIVWLYLYEMSRTGKSIATGSVLAVARGWREGMGNVE